ncbi:hypothetical protein LTR84_010417 [Exophiala bonariae]|uniref:Uncharacterized protein n=1 Tax=Exophiala bonariae TaxID=1690606 RepID=A0AAV9MX24_9EURO|nr:hypothetical protein LTR84_010417 [Exophiala bonariae]
MGSKVNFSLKRLIDGLEYRFTLRSGHGKASVFARDDNVVEIVYHQMYGWTTWQESQGHGEPTLTGRVWEVLPQDQGDFPTEGIWVSRKGPKSYVYTLEYQK